MHPSKFKENAEYTTKATPKEKNINSKDKRHIKRFLFFKNSKDVKPVENNTLKIKIHVEFILTKFLKKLKKVKNLFLIFYLFIWT